MNCFLNAVSLQGFVKFSQGEKLDVNSFRSVSGSRTAYDCWAWDVCAIHFVGTRYGNGTVALDLQVTVGSEGNMRGS